MEKRVHPILQAEKLLRSYLDVALPDTMLTQRPMAYVREVRKRSSVNAAIAALRSCSSWEFES